MLCIVSCLATTSTAHEKVLLTAYRADVFFFFSMANTKAVSLLGVYGPFPFPVVDVTHARTLGWSPDAVCRPIWSLPAMKLGIGFACRAQGCVCLVLGGLPVGRKDGNRPRLRYLNRSSWCRDSPTSSFTPRTNYNIQ